MENLDTRHREFRVYGPPGTGKTTHLSRLIEEAYQEFDEQILVASFTRAAAVELANRNLPLPSSNIGTLHAHCFRALDRPTIAEGKLREWNEAHPEYELSLGSRTDVDDPYGDNAVQTEGDKLSSELQVLRAQMIPRERWSPDVTDFSDTWNRWKREAGYQDFTDLIEMGYHDLDAAPGDPDIGFFDECFPASTPITMENGRQLSIGEIVEDKVSEKVLSYNHTTHEIEPKKIVGWYKVPKRNKELETFAGLTATQDHPVFTQEYGYLSWEKCIDLATVTVLSLDYEKLRREREAHRERAFDRNRFASWRCLDQQESRCQWELQGAVCSVSGASLSSQLEVSKSSTVGHHTTGGSDQNRLWWRSFYLCNKESSGFYGVVSSVFSHFSKRKNKETHHRESSIRFGRSGFGRMVYGRWKLWAKFSENIYLLLRRSRSGFGSRLSEQEGNEVCLLPYLQGSDSRLHGRRVKGARCEGRAIYEPHLQSQNIPENEKEGCPQIIDTSRVSLSRQDEKRMSYMRRIFRRPKVSGAVREGSLPLKKVGVAPKKLESEESFVFCIDVRDNHNFFANGILVHNCQDFTRLELALVRKWGGKMEHLVLAGDADQSIYGFKGATPDAFLAPSVLPANRQVLGKSWRVPYEVHRVSQQWIKRIPDREPVTYSPRDDDGQVIRSSVTLRDPERLAELLWSHVREDRSVMLLASCSYLIEPLLGELRARGIPFANRYRRKRGDWNPLAKRRGRSLPQRVAGFLSWDPATWEDPHFWSEGEFKDWVELVRSRGVLRRGAKTRVKKWRDLFELTPDHVLEILEPETWQTILDLSLKGDVKGALAWLKGNLLPAHQNRFDYLEQVVKRCGGKTLKAQPRLTVGTIHSVKGGEADVVVLAPDLSRAGMEEWEGGGPGHDAVIRQFYVGMTRAREELILLEPWGSRSVDIE